jgi:hypothetical protein
MEKHLNSCVNGFTGAPMECILPHGLDYISCQDGLGDDSGLCEIMKLCPNQPDCASIYADSLLQQQECIASLKYCRQYTIETNFANDGRGYIPLTNFCIDDTGHFSEQVGGVIDPRGTERDTDMFTTCTHGNGDVVKRNLTGSYAACGGGEDEDEDDQVCSTVFAAGYESFEYDPRYRPWYTKTKKSQKPIWLPPFSFFTLGIGVTYTRSIYETDEATGRQIFAGVLAVDYRCKHTQKDSVYFWYFGESASGLLTIYNILTLVAFLLFLRL